MSRRSRERQRLTDDLELTEYPINISRILKKNSKNMQKIDEAKRGRSKIIQTKETGKIYIQERTE